MHVTCIIDIWYVCIILYIYIKYLPLFAAISQFILVEKKNTTKTTNLFRPRIQRWKHQSLSKPLEKNLVAGLTLVFLKAETIEPKEASKNWKKRTKNMVQSEIMNLSCDLFFIPDPWRSPFQPFKKGHVFTIPSVSFTKTSPLSTPRVG